MEFRIVKNSFIFNGKILFSGTAKELVNNKKAREVYLGDRFIHPLGEN